MVGGKWKFILCDWILLMAGWGGSEAYFFGWIGVGGHILWVSEVYFEWMMVGAHF